MLSNIFTKTLQEKWLGIVIAASLLGAFLMMGMAVYRDTDLSLYTDLPEEVRHLMGYGESTDAAGLTFGTMYGFIGALTLAGVAIAMGSSAVAGEERDGTMGLLLGSPISRRTVLLSKAGALVGLTVLAVLILWAAGYLVLEVIGIEAAGNDVDGLSVHLLANTLFYGLLALAIGAWTGNGGTATGAAAALMLISYLASSVLPLVGGLGDIARAFPWYYFSGSQPLINGADWDHLAVLFGASAIFAAAALIGFPRRDLRERSVGIGLLDELRSHPLTRSVVEQLEGSARVSGISVKAASEHRGLFIVAGLVILVFGIIMGPFYLLIEDELLDLSEEFSDAILAIVGNAEISTPEGWYQTQNFSLTLPIAMIAVVAIMAIVPLQAKKSATR